MALDKSLAFALTGILAACGPSNELIDDNDDGPAPDSGDEDTGDVFTDGYVAAPDYGAMAPDPDAPRVDGGITGAVYREDGGETIPVDGARIVLMTPNLTIPAETGYTGTFSFDVAPGHYIIVVQAKGYWGVARDIVVPREGIHGMEWFMTIEDAEVKALAAQVKLPFATSHGVVSTWFSSAVGGESVHLSVSSAPGVTIDENNAPVVSGQVLPSGAPMLIFSDVEPSRFSAEAFGVSGQSYCRAEASPVGDGWPALPHVVTYVPVICDVQ